MNEWHAQEDACFFLSVRVNECGCAVANLVERRRTLAERREALDEPDTTPKLDKPALMAGVTVTISHG